MDSCLRVYTIYVYVREAGYDKELSFRSTNGKPAQLFNLLYHPLADICYKHQYL